MHKTKTFDLKFQEKDVFKQQLSLWYSIPIHATSKYDAARQAARKLVRLEYVASLMSGQPEETDVLKNEKYYPVWNAKIIDVAKPAKPYEIIVNGGFIINPVTGRQEKVLAERLRDYVSASP